jgi:phage-related protein
MTRDKPIVWLQSEIKTPPFSQAARIEAGILLRRLQSGEMLELPHSRPMPSIGPRCHELHIADRTDAWRIVYRIDRDAVIVLDVFSKKTQQTPALVLKRCKTRLKRYDESATRA